MNATESRTIDKVVRLGTLDKSSVFCRIQFRDGDLSITGVVGPMRNGIAKGGCGQIVMEFKECYSRGYHTFSDITPAPAWNADMVSRFLRAWERWHLNKMRAGTEAQMAALREAGGNPDYDGQCAILKKKGLLSDNGYKYGTRRLREEVPADVIDFLQSLPETDKTPAWV
jgi:hypothetical protein